MPTLIDDPVLLASRPLPPSADLPRLGLRSSSQSPQSPSTLPRSPCSTRPLLAYYRSIAKTVVISSVSQAAMMGPLRTSFSYFLNSSSFCFRYSSISFCASLLASFTRFVRSERNHVRHRWSGNWTMVICTLSGYDSSARANSQSMRIRYLSAQSSAPHARPSRCQQPDLL